MGGVRKILTRMRMTRITTRMRMMKWRMMKLRRITMKGFLRWLMSRAEQMVRM